MHQPTDNYPIITACNSSSTTMEKLPLPLQEKKAGDGMFLEILHRLLDQNDETLAGVISWATDGAFVEVHDTVRFEHYLMPVYFGAKSAYCSDEKHRREPLTTYHCFSRILKSNGFLVTGSGNSFLKDTYSHPLFVRGKREWIRKIIIISDEKDKLEPLANYDSFSRILNSSGFHSHPLFAREKGDLDRRRISIDSEPIPLCQQSRNWPMPALPTSDSTNSGYRQNFQWPSRPPPFISVPQKRKFNKRQYSDSFREALLHRKRSTSCGEAYAQTEKKKNSIIQQHMSEAGNNEDPTEDPTESSIDDDSFEPLNIAATASCNVSLEMVRLFADSDRTPIISNMGSNSSLIPDDEPLDLTCHEDDDSLQGDIAKALARI